MTLIFPLLMVLILYYIIGDSSTLLSYRENNYFMTLVEFFRPSTIEDYDIRTDVTAATATSTDAVLFGFYLFLKGLIPWTIGGALYGLILALLEKR